MSFDLALQRLINGWAGNNPALDGTMVAFAQYSPVAIALVLLWIYIVPAPQRRWRRRLAICGGVSALAALALNFLISHAWYRPRPFVALPHTVRLLVAHANDSSFPSDHTAVAFAIAIGLWPLGTPWRRSLVALAVLVGFARVFAGLHWPTDALAAAALGSTAAIAVRRLAPAINPWLDSLLDRLGALGRDARGGDHQGG